MKLKYYLRGLGIGIVVAVCIMTVAFQNRKPMTDEEIKARAAELGMIENSVLTNIAGKNEEVTDEPEDVPDKEPEKELEETPDKEPEQDVKQEDVQEPDSEDTDAEKTDTEETVKDVISITVVSGDNSWTVSKKMEEAGLVESAKDFDTHLCRYGYDKKISVGTYEIPVSATHEEMAKILTKMD